MSSSKACGRLVCEKHETKGDGPLTVAIKTLEDMPSKNWDVNRRPDSAEAHLLVQALQYSEAPHPALQHPGQLSPRGLLA